MAQSIRFSLAPLALALCALSACAAPDRDARGLETPALAESAASSETPKPEAASGVKTENTSETAQPKSSLPEAEKIPEPRAISPVSGSPAASDYAERPDVQAFIKKLSAERGIPLDWLSPCECVHC